MSADSARREELGGMALGMTLVICAVGMQIVGFRNGIYSTGAGLAYFVGFLLLLNDASRRRIARQRWAMSAAAISVLLLPALVRVLM